MRSGLIARSGFVSSIACASFGSALFCAQPKASAALTLDYEFNGNVTDTSGNNYNGTVNGTEAYTPGGTAFAFNGGTNIATTTTDNLGLVNNSFTVFANVSFHTPTGGDLSVFGTPTQSQNLGLHLIERGDQAFMGFFGDDSHGSTPLAADTFYKIAWVYDASSHHQLIYLNGVLESDSAGHNNFQGTGETAFVGSSCCGGQMNGAIDQLLVFNSALSATDVAALPEPATAVLVGVLALGGLLRRRHPAAI